MPKHLEFRYVFQSAAVKENTVNVFGETGTLFEKGTDYDELITLYVPKQQLSNLILYYNGITPDGQVGAQDPGSLRSDNAPVDITTISTWRMRNPDPAAPQTNENGYYYLGDVVLFQKDGSGSKSCWTCVKTTSSITDPILAKGSFDPYSYFWPKGRKAYTDGAQHSDGGGVAGGFYGFNRINQPYIANVPPQTIDFINTVSANKFTTVNHYDYWQESRIATAYSPDGIYYTDNLVIYNDTVFKCIDTNGYKTTPPLYQKPPEIEGVTYGPASLVDAPNGAFGYDWQGTRYIEGIKPLGDEFSQSFWVITTLPRVPTSTYTFLNWDNVKVHEKIQFYDDNILGFKNNQTLNTFTDDSGTDIYTLTSIYNANSKGFSLARADKILASIPAAAIKSQLAGNGLAVDFTLDQMVHSGPVKTTPFNYTPTVQGIFEDALAQDMMRSSGPLTSMSVVRVTSQSMGFLSAPTVSFSEDTLATNPTALPTPAVAVGKLGIGLMIPINPGTGYSVGDKLMLNNNLTNKNLDTPAAVYVYGINADGGILSVSIVNPGDGYLAPPAVSSSAGINNGHYETVTPDGTPGLGTGADFSLKMTLTNVSFTAFKQLKPIGEGDVFRISATSGSGSGGKCATKTPFGMTEVPPDSNFDLVFNTLTDTRVDATLRVSDVYNGSGYALGDVIQLVKQGGFPNTVTSFTDSTYDYPSSANPITRLAVVDTVNGSGNILGAHILMNGFGYLKAPTVTISSPPKDLTASASLTDFSSISNSAYKCFETTDFATTGRYSMVPLVKGSLSNAAVYLGLGNARVLRAGKGFSIGDMLTVGQGGLMPAKIKYNSLEGYLVYDGGSGYYKGQKIFLSDPSGATVQNLYKVEEIGGAILSMTIGTPSRPFGENFEIGDRITIDTATNLQGVVTSVGAAGQLKPNIDAAFDKISFTNNSTPVSYAIGDTVNLVADYPILSYVSVDNPGYGYTTVPTITYAWKSSATRPTQPLNLVLPTVECVLGVLKFNITQGGTGYKVGDTLTILPGNSVVPTTPAVAEVGVIDPANGAIRAITILVNGSGYTVPPTATIGGAGTGAVLQSVLKVVNVKVIGSGNNVYSENLTPTFDLKGGFNLAVSTTTKITGSGGQATVKKAFGGTNTIETTKNISDYLTLDFLGDSYRSGNTLKIVKTDVTDKDFKSSDLYPEFKISTTGTFYSNITSIDVTEGYSGYNYVYGKTQTSNAYKANSSVRIVVPGFESTSPVVYPTFMAIATGASSAISKISRDSGGISPGNNTFLYHKVAATARVQAIDSLGGITEVSITYGYGYTSIPQITIPDGSAGTGAILKVDYLQATRLEAYEKKQLTGIGSLLKIETSTEYAEPKAFAAMCGDLYPADLNTARNPKILEQLELAKPGSTTGLASAVPVMGVSAVSVQLRGQGYGPVPVSGVDGTFTEYKLVFTEPELKNGKQPVTKLNINGSGGINSIQIIDQGNGYLKIPSAALYRFVVKYKLDLSGHATAEELSSTLAADQTGSGSGFLVDTIYMNILSAKILSGGAGYSDSADPAISFTPDTLGNVPVATPRMKRAMLAININNRGAYYTEAPNARVQGDGGGVSAPNLDMCLADIRIVDGNCKNVISKYNRLVVDCYVPDVDIEFVRRMNGSTVAAESGAFVTKFNANYRGTTNSESADYSIKNHYVYPVKLTDLYDTNAVIGTAEFLRIGWFDSNAGANITRSFTTVTAAGGDATVTNPVANTTLSQLATSIQAAFGGKYVTTLVPMTITHINGSTGVKRTWNATLGSSYNNQLTSAFITSFADPPTSGEAIAFNTALATLGNRDVVTVTVRPLFITSSANSTDVIRVPETMYDWVVAQSDDHDKTVQPYNETPNRPFAYVAAVSTSTDSVGAQSFLVTSVAFGIVVGTQDTATSPWIYSVQPDTGLVACGGDYYLKNPAVVGIISHTQSQEPVVNPPSFSTRLGIVGMAPPDTRYGSNFKSDPAVLIDNPPETQQAQYTAGIVAGSVTKILATAYGSGYITVPKVQFAGGGGGGASANAKLGATVVSIQNGGRGYVVGDQLLWTKNPKETTLDAIIQPPVAVVSGLDSGGATLGDGLAIDIPSVLTTPISWNGTTVSGGTFSSTTTVDNLLTTYRDIQQFTDTDETGTASTKYSTLCMNVGNQIDGGAGLYNYRVNDTVSFKEREFLYVLDYTTKLANALKVLTTTTIVQRPTLTLGQTVQTAGMLTGVALNDAFFNANASDLQKAPFFCVGDYVLITGSVPGTVAILRLNANAKSYDYGSFNAPDNLRFSLPSYNDYQRSKGASYISNISPENTNYTTVFEVAYSSGGWTAGTTISTAKLIIQTSNTGLTTDNAVVYRVASPTYKVTRVYYSGLRSSVADAPGLPVYVTQLTAGVATRYMKMNTGCTVDSTGNPTSIKLSSLELLHAQFVENASKDDFGRQYPNMIADTFRLPYMEFTCANRGEITSITLTNFGSGYTRPPTCRVDSVAGTGAIVTPLLGVTQVQLITSGSNYVSQPIVYIDPPLHLSAPPEYLANAGAILTFSIVGNGGKGYRSTDLFRSAVKAANTFTPPGLSVSKNTPSGSALYDRNEYILNPVIDGTLHGLNFPDALTATVQIRVDNSGSTQTGPNAGSPFTDGNVGAVTDVILVKGGSNYRVGDILEIIDNTKDGVGRAATIRVDSVSDQIAKYPDVLNASGALVGGSVFYNPKNFGTGYTLPPKARVVGGNQGVTLSTTLSLSGVDLFNLQSGGSEYHPGDRVYASSPELGGSKLVGTVQNTRVSQGVSGIITSILMYTPFMKLMTTPSISVQRGTNPTASAVDAVLVPVMGVDNVQITLSPDGFVGGSLIAIDAPTGISNGYIPATPAQLSAKIFKDVTEIIITQPASPLKYNTVPIITIDAPKGYDPTSFVGWYAMSFDKGDALDTIVQYTIGKALSFQVDPDASLPGKYFTAESIMIGGVNIPLRAAGSRGAQGREMSANKIIHRYLVRYLAI